MSAVQVRGSWTCDKGEGFPLNNFRLLSDGQIQSLHYGAAICDGFTGHLKCVCVNLSTQSLNYQEGNKQVEREAPREAGEQYPKAREASLFWYWSAWNSWKDTLLEFRALLGADSQLYSSYQPYGLDGVSRHSQLLHNCLHSCFLKCSSCDSSYENGKIWDDKTHCY